MELRQKIAIGRKMAARRAALAAAPVAVESVKPTRTPKQIASDLRFGEMVRARIAASKAAKAEAETVAA